MNLLVHMDARGTSSVYPHLGIRATYFTRWPWPGLRGATHLDDCLGPGHCFGLGYVARLSRSSGNSGSAAGTPGCRLGRFRNSESVKVKGKQNVLHSCVRHGLNLLWTSSSRFPSPATIVSDRASVRMTGLIAATSPLPESTAFHNGVIQATRGCAARPCERSAEFASGRPSSMHGEFLRVPGYGNHHLGLGQQHRMGQVTYALREPTSARRSKLPYPAYPSGCHKASQHIPIAGQPESAVGQSPRLSQQRTPTAPDGSDAWAPAKPRQDAVLIRSLARARRWKAMLEERAYRSAGEIAGAEGITRSFVNRLLRLTLLAPDIQEAIIDGRQPRACSWGS